MRARRQRSLLVQLDMGAVSGASIGRCASLCFYQGAELYLLMGNVLIKSSELWHLLSLYPIRVSKSKGLELWNGKA